MLLAGVGGGGGGGMVPKHEKVEELSPARSTVGDSCPMGIYKVPYNGQRLQSNCSNCSTCSNVGCLEGLSKIWY